MNLLAKKILVTGGAGFIGSHICEALVRRGARVSIIDNFSSGKLSNLKNIIKKVKLIIGDVENFANVVKAIKNCDFVIHEAFPYGKSGMGLEQQYINTGIIGTYNILKASVKYNVKKVVNVSTVSAYGITDRIPLKEDMPVKAFLPYGVTKYAGELYCKAFSKVYGLNTISLRYFYVFGPKYAQFDHSALIKFLINAINNRPLVIYGTGSQLRDYTYIDNIVEGTLLALGRNNDKGEVYNISSGMGLTIFELAKLIRKVLKKDLPVIFADQRDYVFSDKYCKIPVGLTSKKGSKWVDERRYVGDITKAKKELRYRPKVGIEEGIKRTLEWLRSEK